MRRLITFLGLIIITAAIEGCQKPTCIPETFRESGCIFCVEVDAEQSMREMDKMQRNFNEGNPVSETYRLSNWAKAAGLKSIEKIKPGEEIRITKKGAEKALAEYRRQILILSTTIPYYLPPELRR